MGTILRRPKEIMWATDNVYGTHGQDWDGEDNKEKPLAGYIAEGIKPGDCVDAPEWNWWRDYVSRFLQFIGGIQLANWDLGDFSDVDANWCAGGSVPVECCYDDSIEAFTAVSGNGETIYSYDPTDGAATPAMGGQGLIWENETTNPRTLGYQVRDLACDNNGKRIAIEGNSLVMVMISTALNTWNTQATASSVVWGCVDHDHDGGLWAVAGASGTINTSPNGTTWTARTSGVSGTIVAMKHNNDTDDPKWVGLTTTQVVWSSDGITWSYASHGLTSNPVSKRLAYNKESKRWIAVLTNGHIGISDNQGQTWTQVSNPFGLGAVSLSYNTCYIDSDEQDGWIFHYCPTGTTSIQQRHVSKDNGENWHRVYEGMLRNGLIKWGTDKFVCVGSAACSYSVRLLGA